MAWSRRSLRIASVPVAVAAAAFVGATVDLSDLASTWTAMRSDPSGLALASIAYAAAFAIRAAVWSALLPQLGLGHSWSAIHLSLAANHLLPFRLGEVVRPVTAARRTTASLAATTASTVVMRSADVAAVVGLALLLAPSTALDLGGPWIGALAIGVVIAGAGGLRWLGRAGYVLTRSRLGLVMAVAVAGWLLESLVILSAATWAGIDISYEQAVLVTAVTIAAQIFALAPGGFGTYEAAGTAALVAHGAQAAPALAAVLVAHALKTAYSLITGLVALFVPEPGALGRLRLTPRAPAPAPSPSPTDAPVVLFLPAFNEEATIASVIRRAPASVCGRRVRVLVIDDGSSDRTAALAAEAGAEVIRMPGNRGLGAAVRQGLASSLSHLPACVVFCDADGEYAPDELETVAAPILEGRADYVVGSRFAGEIRRMLPHRRVGNMILTKLLCVVARRRISDGQSGYRALSPAAARAAEVIHDYNYAQVLTLDLLGKGFRYEEVPISYSFRHAGRSFIRLGRYLRRVIPAVYAELNDRVADPASPPQRAARTRA